MSEDSVTHAEYYPQTSAQMSSQMPMMANVAVFGCPDLAKTNLYDRSSFVYMSQKINEICDLISFLIVKRSFQYFEMILWPAKIISVPVFPYYCIDFLFLL